jgi:hypothetical protein
LDAPIIGFQQLCNKNTLLSNVNKSGFFFAIHDAPEKHFSGTSI